MRERLGDVQCAVEEAVGMPPGDLAGLQQTIKELTVRVREVVRGVSDR